MRLRLSWFIRGSSDPVKHFFRNTRPAVNGVNKVSGKGAAWMDIPSKARMAEITARLSLIVAPAMSIPRIVFYPTVSPPKPRVQPVDPIPVINQPKVQECDGFEQLLNAANHIASFEGSKCSDQGSEDDERRIQGLGTVPVQSTVSYVVPKAA